MGDQGKQCGQCNRTLPLIDFPLRGSSPDGHHSWCIECKREKDRDYSKAYAERDPERKRRNARRYSRTEAGRISRSARQLWSKYRLTPETFAAKLEAQGGVCPFCAPGEVPPYWDVDHDHRCCSGNHTCGKCIRDLLCPRHNLGLGIFDDNPEALRAAADYIEAYRLKIVPTGRTLHAKRGEGHQAWKGEDASLQAKQERVYRARGAAVECVDRATAGCISKRYEWALPPGADPDQPESFVSLCSSCRMKLYGMTGGGHANALITDEQAREIRERYAAGGISQRQLGIEYGIAQPTVSTIVRGTRYKN